MVSKLDSKTRGMDLWTSRKIITLFEKLANLDGSCRKWGKQKFEEYAKREYVRDAIERWESFHYDQAVILYGKDFSELLKPYNLKNRKSLER